MKLAKRQNRGLNDKLFFVSGEGHTEEEYIDEISPLFQGKIRIIPVKIEEEKSAPLDAVRRLVDYVETNKNQLGILDEDEKWVFIDTDHHFNGTHQKNVSEAYKQARQTGCKIAVSNPNINFWLLSHFMKIDGEVVDIDKKLKEYIPGFEKHLKGVSVFTKESIYMATQNCAEFEFRRGNDVRGSEVYKMFEECMKIEKWLD